MGSSERLAIYWHEFVWESRGRIYYPSRPQALEQNVSRVGFHRICTIRIEEAVVGVGEEYRGCGGVGMERLFLFAPRCFCSLLLVGWKGN